MDDERLTHEIEHGPVRLFCCCFFQRQDKKTPTPVMPGEAIQNARVGVWSAAESNGRYSVTAMRSAAHK